MSFENNIVTTDSFVINGYTDPSGTGNAYIDLRTGVANHWGNNSYLNPMFVFQDSIDHYITKLKTWQDTTKSDANSIIADPKFVSTTDFTPTNSALAGRAKASVYVLYGSAMAGGYSTTITDDINHNLRGLKPDIGAVQFSATKIYSKDVGTSDIIRIQNCGSDSSLIGIRVTNIGKTAQSGFSIKANIAGQSGKVNYTFKNTIAPNKDTTVYVGFSPAFNTRKGGIFKITAYTVLAGDSDAVNDTTVNTLQYDTMPKVKPFSKTGIITICRGDSLRLYDSSFVKGYSTWHFGDGKTTSKKSVSHYYKKAGKYRVLLSVTNSAFCTDTISALLTVDSSRFYIINKTVCVRDSVKIIDSSISGNGTNHKYYVLDNKGSRIDSSIQKNPYFTVTKGGYYRIEQVITINSSQEPVLN